MCFNTRVGFNDPPSWYDVNLMYLLVVFYNSRKMLVRCTVGRCLVRRILFPLTIMVVILQRGWKDVGLGLVFFLTCVRLVEILTIPLGK